MLKICVMGDSHVATLKRGWMRIGDDFPHIELTFFAAAATDWSNLRAARTKLLPCSEALREQFSRSSRGQTEISDGFDAYLLCSIGLWIAVALRQHVRQQQPDRGFHRADVAKYVQNTNCARVLQMLRWIAAKPAMLVAAPFQPQEFCLVSPMIDDDTASKIRNAFFEECEALAAAHGATFMPQPASTWAPNGVTTRMEFANPAAAGQEIKDRHHCNAEYGAIVLRSILERWPAAD